MGALMWLLDFLQNLSLPVMFLSTLVIGIALCWIILVFVRCGIRLGGMDRKSQVPMRDMIAPISAIFALMLAFSAAGIWNDSLQANSAVQREANALENVIALAASLPADLTEKVKGNVGRYGRQVVEIDWPAMARKVGVNDQVYDVSDGLLVEIINLLSREHAR